MIPGRRRFASACSAFALLLASAGAAGCGGSHEHPSPSALPTPVVRAAEIFLNRYVGADGRVVRWDQGGDTVSEGQAYAMVIASALGQDNTVNRVWAWTERHLMQPNGLPAWRIDASGKIIDTQSASDADILLAWTLLNADGNEHAELRAAGLRIADAVLSHEVIVTPGGQYLLAAGPWAVGRGVVNVSYWSTAIFEFLAAQSGDARWAMLAADATRLLAELTNGGRTLPPDWSQLVGERLVATASPVAVGSSPSDTPQYGLDAQRTVVWSSASCQQSERRYPARWHELIDQPLKAQAMSLGLDGEVINPTTHPVPLIAAAAAAAAAGSSGERFLAQAEAELTANPTFFGSAWDALGRILMDPGSSLNLCAR